jgi:UDP-glucuronate 4-epimerase
MRALVTGCAGFIGSHLTESLLADGHTVVGVDRFNDNYSRLVKAANMTRTTDWPRFRFVEGDLATMRLDDLVEDCDVVFHLAAEPGVRSSWGKRFDFYLHNNVLSTQRLLEASRANPERRFVYASSSSIYGDALTLPTPEEATPQPFSPYGMTKLSAEQLCDIYHANHGIRTVALRYFSVYGPRQRPDMAFHRFCRAAARGEALEVYGDGTQTRDFTYVGDIVRATRAAAVAERAPGNAYNVGGGTRVSLNRTIELLAGIAGRPLDVRRRGRELGDVVNTGADITRARNDLGFAPRVSLEEGLAAEYAWIADRARTLVVRPDRLLALA